MSNHIAIYPGTFDPITNGHLSIINRAVHLFDHVIVALAAGRHKQPLFSVEERLQQLTSSISQPTVSIEKFSGLLVDYAREKKANCIIRGLRAAGDFEYEFQLAHMNRKLAPEIETVFLMTDEENFYLSSSMIKEVAYLGGDISTLVPASVTEALKKKNQ